ncbi:MAG: DUF971 domain-containing protein [Bacteroidota bacterium]
MQVTSIKRTAGDILTMMWDDGHASPFSLRLLRDECPCAGCKGETVLLHTFHPSPQPDGPGRYDLKSITPVGSYAIQIAWGDGHDTGLYSWDYLREICPCGECTRTKS